MLGLNPGIQDFLDSPFKPGNDKIYYFTGSDVLVKDRIQDSIISA
jgi:hypothetical protein